MNTKKEILASSQELPDADAAPGDPTDKAFAPLCAQIEFFERAAGIQGCPRERLVALGEAEELYFQLFPHHYRALQTIRVASQLGKAVGDQQDPALRCESRLLAIVMSIMKDAMQKGDLHLREGQGPGELAFTLWALSFGTRALMDTRVATRQLGVRDAFLNSRQTTDLLLDALGWRPLNSEWDYASTRRHIRENVFKSEWEAVSRCSK